MGEWRSCRREADTCEFVTQAVMVAEAAGMVAVAVAVVEAGGVARVNKSRRFRCTSMIAWTNRTTARMFRMEAGVRQSCYQTCSRLHRLLGC